MDELERLIGIADRDIESLIATGDPANADALYARIMAWIPKAQREVNRRATAGDPSPVVDEGGRRIDRYARLANALFAAGAGQVDPIAAAGRGFLDGLEESAARLSGTAREGLMLLLGVLTVVILLVGLKQK